MIDADSFGWQPDDVMLHRPPLALLQEIVSCADGAAIATVLIGPDSSFFQADRGVPVWIGIEYMAQTVAVIGGVRARGAGRPAPLGLLIGCHGFASSCSHFPDGALLRVSVREIVADSEGLGAFECRIDAEGVEVTARLTVYVNSELRLDDLQSRRRLA